MTTTYDLIYDRFLSKITDYELAALLDADLQKNLLKYLRGAITDFKYCTQDISLSNRDDSGQKFNVDLTETEQEIIAKFMLVHWLNPNVMRLENIRDHIGSKDTITFSPANFLDKLKGLKTDLYNEAVSDMNFYYYATP